MCPYCCDVLCEGEIQRIPEKGFICDCQGRAERHQFPHSPESPAGCGRYFLENSHALRCGMSPVHVPRFHLECDACHSYICPDCAGPQHARLHPGCVEVGRKAKELERHAEEFVPVMRGGQTKRATE